jgi:hypothetical protein
MKGFCGFPIGAKSVRCSLPIKSETNFIITANKEMTSGANVQNVAHSDTPTIR